MALWSRWSRRIGLLVFGAAACVVVRQEPVELSAQDRAPARHELTIVARDFRWMPDRIELTQDDLVKLTVRSEDIAYGFAIDEYRIVRRVPAGGETNVEFQASRAGTYRFYSNLTSDPGHAGMQGQMIVIPR